MPDAMSRPGAPDLTVPMVPSITPNPIAKVLGVQHLLSSGMGVRNRDAALNFLKKKPLSEIQVDLHYFGAVPNAHGRAPGTHAIGNI